MPNGYCDSILAPFVQHMNYFWRPQDSFSMRGIENVAESKTSSNNKIIYLNSKGRIVIAKH